MDDIDYRSLPDEKLIEFKNTQSSTSDMRIQAEIELDRRDRERQKFNLKTQKSIKRMTKFILFFSIITLVVTLIGLWLK